MTRLLLICLGGALGTGSRYLLVLWAVNRWGTLFPIGTLMVNVIGSLLLGIIMQAGASTDVMSETTRAVLATGVMGGFTTYSSFNYETTRYLGDGAYGLAAFYMFSTALLCLAAGLAGLIIGRAVLR